MFEIKPEVEKLVSYANSKNKELYLVGGAVRDLLLGKTNILDFDMVGNVSLEEFLVYAEINNIKVEVLNKKLGVVRFVFDGFVVECARMRTEVYDNSFEHNPKEIEFVNTIEEDCKRRDFSCNSLYYDFKSGEIKDFFNGVEDLHNKVIKHIKVNGVSSLEFDPVRILRLISFAFKLGFDIDEETLKIALKNKQNIYNLSNERFKIEIDKIKQYYLNSNEHNNILNLFNINLNN
jgi:tRNA nucleotidyltransferase/poly(A) polymerase